MNKILPMHYGIGSNRTKPGREGHQYPQGDGAIDCPYCHGRGVVVVPEEERPPFSIGEVTRSCICTHRRDTLLNMERGWKGLTKVGPVAGSNLDAQTERNLWITASLHDLQKHVGRVAFDRGRHWNFKVITDVSLLSAWLYSANEVFDADVHMHRQTAALEDRYSRIEDLVEPWDLLIIRLGVKTARNVAAPEVLLEALQIREQLGKATWIVDSPGYPLEIGHISFDDRVGEFLELWDHAVLSEEDRIQAGDPKPRQVNSAFTGKGRIPATAVSTNEDEEDLGDLQEELDGMDEADMLGRLFDDQLTENAQRPDKRWGRGGRRR